MISRQIYLKSIMKNFPLVWLSTLHHLPLTVTSKEGTKFTARLKDFVQVWDSFHQINQSGIFDFEIGEDLRIYDLAQQIIKSEGSRSTIKIIGLREGDTLNQKLLLDSEKEHVTDLIYKVNYELE